MIPVHIINYSNYVSVLKIRIVAFLSTFLILNLGILLRCFRLLEKGERNPDETVALIKEKLEDQDQEIATTSCKVSLACPLGRMRMKIPCRATTCNHLQTFDAGLYLLMNEKKPKVSLNEKNIKKCF